MKKNNSAIQKTINVCYGQNYGIIPKLWYYTKDYEYMIYYGKKYETNRYLEKNPWYYTKNHGTLIYYRNLWGKTVAQYRKRWNFDLLWCNDKNYSTMGKKL